MANRTPFKPYAYLLDGEIALSAQGYSSTGGDVQIFHRDAHVASVSLSRLQFALIAILIRKAQLAADQGMPSKAFVRAKDLADALFDYTGLGASDPNNLHKSILRLRDRLAKEAMELSEHSKGMQWMRDIIETHATFGYRLSLSPDKLHLLLFDEDQKEK